MYLFGRESRVHRETDLYKKKKASRIPYLSAMLMYGFINNSLSSMINTVLS